MSLFKRDVFGRFRLLLTSLTIFSLIACSTDDVSSSVSSQSASSDTSSSSSEQSPEDSSTVSSGSSETQKYTIRWQNYNGEILETDTDVEYGTMPSYDGPIPTRENSEGKEYIFEGWSPEVSKVTGDLTYIATFSSSAIKYTIRFDVDGGYSPSYVASKEVTGFSTDDLFYDCTKTGYHFRGWSYNNEKVVDENGNQLKQFQLAKNMTFRAIFAQTAKLTIVINEGFEDAPSSISETTEYPYNTNVDIYAHPKQGYVFVGWYYNEYPLSNDEEYHYMMWSDDVTIEARFKYDTYTMSIHSYQPSIGQVLISPQQNYQDDYEKDFDYKSNVTIAAYTATPIRFLGWFDNDNKLVTTDAVYSFMMPNHDYELTAKWNKFTINYNLDGGTNDSRNPSEYAVEDSIQLYDAVKDGYTFLGWKLNGVFIDNIDGELKTNITLEAIFSLTDYRINYHLNGGVNNPSNPEAYNYEDDVINLANPSREGCTFAGWYKESTFENQVISIPHNSVGSINLYAKWTPNNYSITYYLDGGVNNPSNPETYNFEDDVINLANPSRDCYTFAGWYKESTFENQVISIPHNSVGNVELYAKWNPLEELSAFEYSVSNDEITITGLKDNATSSMTIPSVIEFQGEVFSVTSIGDYAFKNCSNLTSIVIPNSVTSIGRYAFLGCSSSLNINYKGTLETWLSVQGKGYINGCVHLYFNGSETETTSIVIPDNITSIGSDTFKNCSNLTSITIPNTVSSIGSCAFYGCSNLTSITIHDSVTSIGDYAFKNCFNLTSITIPNSVTSIGSYTFSHCSRLTSITIPDNVTSIGSYSFSYCSRLTSITIPNSVTSIGENAFDGCSSSLNINYKGTLESWLAIQGKNNLEGRVHLYLNGSETETTSIVIPDNITSIGNYAFYNCSSLTSITLPDSVTSLGQYAFSNCAAAIIWGDNPTITTIGNYAFRDYKGASITIPDSVTSIGERAFYNCSNPTSIVIPNSVTSIGSEAFSGCAAEIIWGDNPTIKTIGSYDFGYYNGTTITIPNSVTSIGYKAFYNCSNLTSITIPNSVTSIGDYAFYNCSNLTSITIPNSVTSISDHAFSGCSSLVSITLPFVGHSKTATTASSSTLLGYIFGTSNYTGGTSTTQYYAGGSATYYIPTSLRNVTITGGNILYGAFCNCSNLTSITIPNTVTSIDRYAFSGCAAEIIWGDNPTIKTIGSYAFGDYEGTSITIPNSVTSIDNSAFYNCSNLTSIIIPNTVTSIGVYAFSKCSKLNSVYYTGSSGDWSSIAIASGNAYLTGATRYYYSETEPTEPGNYWHYVNGVPTIW